MLIKINVFNENTKKPLKRLFQQFLQIIIIITICNLNLLNIDQ